MCANFFVGAPEDVERARAFYLGIVGSESIVRLTVALKLRLTDGGQDWDIEVSDAGRVAEFLDYFESHPLDDEERYDLLTLIVASLDDSLTHHDTDAPLSARVRRHLDESFQAFGAIVQYWACLNEPGHVRFAVTPMMRELWQAHQKVDS